MIVQSIEVHITSCLVMDFRLYMQMDIFISMQAARNCLVDGNNNVKVADYSLALYTSSRKPSRTVVSIKWAAPELIVPQPMFTTKSDVWSFGKLLVGYIPQPQGSWGLVLWNLFSGLPTVRRGSPGPFYHVHDANVYLFGRQTGGVGPWLKIKKN